MWIFRSFGRLIVFRLAKILIIWGVILGFGPAQAIAGTNSPTVAEVEKAFNGYVTEIVGASDNPIILRFKPGGILEIEVETPVNVIFVEAKWWVENDASLCTESERRGKVCHKTIKKDGYIIRIDSKGKRFGKEMKITR